MKHSTLFKNIFFSISCLIGVLSIARFCHHATQGFALSKIQENLINSNPIPTSEDQKAWLGSLKTQKFHYLARGMQSFAFESEDGQYVLKLFNNRYQRNIQFFSLLSHFPCIKTWALSRMHYFENKLCKAFNSYQIAYDQMPQQTGLLYAHLYPTCDLPGSLTIVDPLNIHHQIDLNRVGFLLQKKATLVYPTLKTYLQNQDRDGAKKALSSLIELFFWKWRQGIADNDPLIRTNYGFCDGRAIQIDVGPLSPQNPLMDLEQYKKEIERITASLKNWLNKNAPELIPFLDQELQQQLSLQE